MTLGITNSFLGTIAGSGGGAKILISATPAPSATVSTYSGYIVFKFTASGTLNVGAGAPGTADAFVLGGGFSGGSGSPMPPAYDRGGTGGAGGRRVTSPAVTITSGTPVSVTVGGAASNSSFGPVSSAPGPTGGSGGSGGNGAGPPGFGSPGSPGGTGPSNNYQTGSNQSYGGGGGGGGGGGIQPSGAPGGSGGSTGGGGGGTGSRFVIPGGHTGGGGGGSGTANTGGGGGGGGGGGLNGSPSPGGGGTGGSGVVVVRFPDAQFTT